MLRIRKLGIRLIDRLFMSFLIVSAESEGNVDNYAYTYVPDMKVPLVRLPQPASKLCCLDDAAMSGRTHAERTRMASAWCNCVHSLLQV
jgi:hypothetical protein